MGGRGPGGARFVKQRPRHEAALGMTDHGDAEVRNIHATVRLLRRSLLFARPEIEPPHAEIEFDHVERFSAYLVLVLVGAQEQPIPSIT